MKNIAETSGIDNKNNVINIFKGIVISFILTLILLFIFSTILTYTQIPESTIGPVIIIITVISILIGSSISTIKIRKNGIINGGIIGMIYILILYLFSSMFETGFSVNIYSVIMIVFSIIAGIIGKIKRKNIKK